MDSRFNATTEAGYDIGLSLEERQLAGMPDPISDASNGPLWFDAVLRPHRSLGRRGYLVMFGLVFLVSSLAVLRFLFLGAWPVAALFFLDAALLWGGFKLSYATARAFEAIQLSEDALVVTKVSWRGKVQSWVFHPHWVRVEIEGDGDDFAYVHLREGHKSVSLGECLSQTERFDMGQTLQTALVKKKAGGKPLLTRQAAASVI